MFNKINEFALDHPIITGYATAAFAVVVYVVVTTKIDDHMNRITKN